LMGLVNKAALALVALGLLDDSFRGEPAARMRVLAPSLL
jgi:hypothetical protein